jgi:hypothetical protein
MTKPDLLKKLEAMLDEFERGRTWGTIEIEIREGKPNYVRKMTTEKLYEETSRARYEITARASR